MKDAGKPTAPQRRKPPPPPIVAYEDVKAACGHIEKFGLFADKQDKFRDARRDKVRKRPCKACRAQKQKEQEEAAKVRRSRKKQNMVAYPNNGRLPDGAKFDLSYDATVSLWRGTLAVLGTTFTDTGATERRLCSRLDRQYRQAVAAVAEKPAAPTE